MLAWGRIPNFDLVAGTLVWAPPAYPGWTDMPVRYRLVKVRNGDEWTAAGALWLEHRPAGEGRALDYLQATHDDAGDTMRRFWRDRLSVAAGNGTSAQAAWDTYVRRGGNGQTWDLETRDRIAPHLDVLRERLAVETGAPTPVRRPSIRACPSRPTSKIASSRPTCRRSLWRPSQAPALRATGAVVAGYVFSTGTHGAFAQ